MIMKKTNLFSKLTVRLAAVCIFFMLSACQKDETTQPATASESLTSSGDKIIPVNPVQAIYDMIRINHIAGRGLAPDYEVTVSTDMNVLFIGRRNTATLGKKIFKTDEKTLALLREMFVSSNLFNVPAGEVNPNENTSPVDRPQVFTSFNNGHYTVTLLDHDTGEERKLYELRTEAERMLNIPALVYGFDHSR